VKWALESAWAVIMLNLMCHLQVFGNRATGPAWSATARLVVLMMLVGPVLFAGPAVPPPDSPQIAGPSAIPASRPDPSGANGAGAFASGRYRNLFAEAGHPAAEITNKINAAFQQLFHGD